MFHPAPTRVISVPTLEQAATLSMMQFNVAAPTSNMPPPPPPPSAAGNNLSIVSKCSSRKGRKRLRTEPEDEERPCYPQPLEELLKMTVIQLKKVAADNSKHAMSAKDKKFFLDFYQEQEQMMAIKAIERGVSLPMVHAILGRRVAFKEANRWNCFLQTNQAQLIFQRSGLGVKDKAVMNELSKAYNQLSEEEKAALTNVPDDLSANNEQNPDHDGDGSADPSQPPGQRAITHGTVSPRIRWEQANAAMDRWLSEAVDVAKSCSCEVVIFAVSNHLGSHSFQLSQTTPGASAPHKAITDIDGNHQYTARLQAYIAGVDITSLAMDRKVSANPDSLRSQLHQLTQAMAKFVNNETGGILKEWPWTDTDHNLWVAGYRLEISACPAFNIQWLRSPTRAQHLVEVRIFMRELRKKRIRLVPRTNNETEPSWATVLKTNKCPTCSRESHLHNPGGDAASLLDTTAPASSHANN
ncbi:hypothetical protein PCANC_21758 [Puccinia coronata f. sp. avenae]|uniref:Uncharacterized protein n=1 Tax=Puccinia coronata f. sp. avenae TaxID=200324 RepID=A0A2N5TUY3_9BASI|nr:hypothetical protein PCANC_21758 [Puccinia coronata f. sp. avenae]